ncbi:MAG: Gfo/Idh/MocA family protein [Vicinamibacterales bacterium]
MPTKNGKLGVGICGVGWCGSQHIQAFEKHPHSEVTWLYGGGDEQRTRASMAKYKIDLPTARVARTYEEMIASPDVDIVSISSPNHLHAAQAVAAADAGRHMLLEKPTGLEVRELISIRDAVRRAGVRSIVSFELRYNALLRFAHWLQQSGALGAIRFARVQYLSRVTDWYAGWNWVRTLESGRSHLLAAGCHAVDALRWCSGQEAVAVSALHTRFTEGYEWPTSIIAKPEAERRWPGTHHELDGFHDALHVPGRADGRSRNDAAGSAAMGEDAAGPRGAGCRQSVRRRSPGGRDGFGGPSSHPNPVRDA